jgi:hypothetical protein
MAEDEVTVIGRQRHEVRRVEFEFWPLVKRLNVMHLDVCRPTARDAGRVVGEVLATHPRPLA